MNFIDPTGEAIKLPQPVKQCLAGMLTALGKLAGLNLAKPKPDIDPASLLDAAQGCAGGGGNKSKAITGGGQFSGTSKPWTSGATPNSTYTHIDSKTGKALQNAIYDADGKVIGHVDFKPHGTLSGHGHTFPPGNPAPGHAPGAPHIPNSQLPPGWSNLPPGVPPHTPIGQGKK